MIVRIFPNKIKLMIMAGEANKNRVLHLVLLGHGTGSAGAGSRCIHVGLKSFILM